MKKLLLIIAMFSLLCYVGKAHAFTKAEWEACAQAEGDKITATLTTREAILKEICGFYKKPLDTCTATYDAAPSEQQSRILTDYIVYGVLIPKCGNPSEAK